MTDTTLVVDGSNIATEGRSLPSLQQLDEAVRALVAERSHDHVIVVVDASSGTASTHQKSNASRRGSSPESS